jgi:hypothetical protein
MQLRELIEATINEYLNESYKLTFNDKKEIDKNIRHEYDKYIQDIKSENEDIKLKKEIVKNIIKQKEIYHPEVYNSLLNRFNYDYYLNTEFKKPMLFNQFYKENFDTILNYYVNRKRKNSLTSFGYVSPNKKVKNINQDDFYKSLSEKEIKSIEQFLDIVSVRVASGTGESVDRKKVRDMFFNTPKSFQELYSEKPSLYLWRGDYTHPCNDDYDHSAKNYLSMQSFSVNKKTAREFGYNFNANNIKRYSGSFSLPLFSEYNTLFDSDINDGEGEIMFFDVEYKCGDKQKDYDQESGNK